jgi:hypothetical protein
VHPSAETSLLFHSLGLFQCLAFDMQGERKVDGLSLLNHHSRPSNPNNSAVYFADKKNSNATCFDSLHGFWTVNLWKTVLIVKLQNFNYFISIGELKIPNQHPNHQKVPLSFPSTLFLIFLSLLYPLGMFFQEASYLLVYEVARALNFVCKLE